MIRKTMKNGFGRMHIENVYKFLKYIRGNPGSSFTKITRDLETTFVSVSTWSKILERCGFVKIDWASNKNKLPMAAVRITDDGNALLNVLELGMKREGAEKYV